MKKFFRNGSDTTNYKNSEKSFLHTSCLMYLILVVIFLLWTFNLLWDRWNDIFNPVSSNGFLLTQYDQLIYPAVTICSLSSSIKIEPKKCSNIENAVECDFIESKHYSKSNLKLSNCLTYNSNIENAFVAKKKGLEDIFFISVGINQFNTTNDDLINGVIVALHSQNKKPNIHSESTIIASPGKIVMLRLKKITNEYLNMTSVESFEAQTTDLKSVNFEENWGLKNNTVVIALSYQNLSVMVIRELPPYQILSFLSEMGGIIGLLLGTSLVNLLISIVQWTWGFRSNEMKFLGIKSKDLKGGVLYKP